MKVQEIMERAGVTQTGRAIAYIKDALEEIGMRAETHIRVQRIDLKKDQRYYKIPFDSIRIIDIRCKNHDNSNNKYRSIPRSIYRPPTEDSDGI
jgi:hypothetical protein